MRWRSGRRSTNISDRRGIPGGGFGIGGCGLLLLIIIGLLTGINPLSLIGVFEQQTPGPTGPPARPGTQEYDEQADFVSVVLADTEDTWSQLFANMNRTYNKPKLVLFSDTVQSACGYGSAAVGPFYCPLDSQVYLDLTFFRLLEQRLGAGGDFAQAYVIAHEVGHHVQNLLGISDEVRRAQESSSAEQANELSVRLELQADCLAGVWGHHADRQRQLLESGDIEEGLNAAAAVGDDRVQQQSGRTISPENWTHGSSRMRAEWFHRGIQSGDPNSCDTFGRDATLSQ